MRGVRHEDRHHTDEQIREIVAFAVALADDEAIPSDLREAVFNTAANMRAAKSITVEQVMPGVPNLAMPRGKL